MQSVKQYIALSWAGNLTRIIKRSVCCEQRHQWSQLTKDRVRESTHNQCFYCRTRLDIKNQPQTQMHVDHYWPYSKGGANLLPNLVPACRRCNLKKSNQRATAFVHRHRTFTKPFCRKLLDGHKYCVEQPHHGNKYCSRHGFLHICDNS